MGNAAVAQIREVPHRHPCRLFLAALRSETAGDYFQRNLQFQVTEKINAGLDGCHHHNPVRRLVQQMVH